MHLMGDLDEAIDCYHQALSCKPDDPFSSEMLNKALQEALSTNNRGEEENNIPNRKTMGIRGSSSLKTRMGREVTSMMSDDGLNLSAESDVDMSVA